MMLKLKKKKWVDKLVSLPESGMGYQVVDITLNSGRIVRKITICDSQSAILPENENFSENDIAKIESTI